MPATTMQTIVPQDLSPQDAYKLLASLIIPRPIAWVSTLGQDGTANLAPFSFFNAVAGNPPTVMVSIGSRKDAPKDTLRNIRETGEFVVNLVNQELAPAMNLTAKEYEYVVNEFAAVGLEPAPSLDVHPPRVAAAAAAMECRATQFVPIQGSNYTMVLGQVLRYHLRDGLLRPNGLVDSARLQPVARMGGAEYTTLGPVFELARPV
jgi:flavin reductase (DIM6/NTAB) family NADH-FMN oxidoreductase RutF